MSFAIGNSLISACPDIAIINKEDNKIILLVQEDKRYNPDLHSRTHAPAQLIAEALAAFAFNNDMYDQNLKSQTIYGIVMLETRVTFYRIPMTKEFYDRTNNKCTIEVESYAVGNSDNDAFDYMVKAPGNMKMVFDCFEVLHELVLEANNSRRYHGDTSQSSELSDV